MNNQNLNNNGGRIKFMLTFCAIAILFFAVTKTNPFSRNMKTLLEDQSGIINENSAEYDNPKDVLSKDDNLEDAEKENISENVAKENIAEDVSKENNEDADAATEESADIENNMPVSLEEFQKMYPPEDYQEDNIHYEFASRKKMEEHFDKHGEEFDYKTTEEYVKGANAVINNPDSLHKYEKEDGDDVYYLESTNEFVVVSKNGYIRTYFKPDKGLDYFNRQ